MMQNFTQSDLNGAHATATDADKTNIPATSWWKMRVGNTDYLGKLVEIEEGDPLNKQHRIWERVNGHDWQEITDPACRESIATTVKCITGAG